MRHRILPLMLLFALCVSASAQTYDEEHEAESFTLGRPLKPDKSYHYTASGIIDLTPGFDYSPKKGKAALLEVDPMGMFPPTYGTTFANALDSLGNTQGAPHGLPYSLPMAADVNDNGAAVIRIPIDCPPGVNGLQPDLSFVYNSQSGDGIMGPGWSIGGMSKISRVPYRYYYSDYSNAVSFTSEDDFSLDGNRLIRSTTNANRYYPEAFDNSVVTYNSGGKSFTVEKPNGFVYTYGGTEDSRYCVIDKDHTVEWHLSMIKDPYGNKISFSYEKDSDGGFYPSKITYSGYTVEFEYNHAARNETQKKFFVDRNGKTGYSKITKTLSHMWFSRGNEAIHSYQLVYSYKGDLPHRELFSIQKFGTYNRDGEKPNDPDNRSASCQFVWKNSIGKLQVDKSCDDVDLQSDDLQMDDTFYPDRVFHARFRHGDDTGLSDIVMLIKMETHPFYRMFALKNDLSYYYLGAANPCKFKLIGNRFDAANEAIQDHDNCSLFAPVDTDGDGFNEILYIYKDSQYSKHYAHLITYNENVNEFEIGGDLLNENLPISDEEYEFFIGDFDGNGCSDILLTNGDFTRVCLSIDGVFNVVVDRQGGSDLYLNSSDHREYVGDFTGDGRDQLVSMMELKTSTGEYKYYTRNVNIVKKNGKYAMEISGRDESDIAAHLFNHENMCVHLCQGDFNGDNKQDFVALMGKKEDRNWYFYLSKGDGSSFEGKTWANSVDYDEIADEFVPIAADFNGDGFTDLSMTRVVVEDYPPNSLNSHTYDFYYRYDFLIRADDSEVRVVRKSVLDEEGNE